MRTRPRRGLCSACWIYDNSIALTRPAIAEQWHPTRNGDLTPEAVTPGSDQTAWWICDRGHEWNTTIYRRCKGRPGCPACNRVSQELP